MQNILPLPLAAALCLTLLPGCQTTDTTTASGLSPMERMESVNATPRTDDPSSPPGGGLRVVEGAAPLAVKEF